MFSPGGVIINFRKPLFIRLALVFFFLVLFWRRISVAVTSISTFVVFTFSPAPVLGNGDGWDLVNLIAPQNATQIMPKIIHHVRLGDLAMRDTWIEANKSCTELNRPEDGWKYELWDTERVNAFVAEEYPEILDTFLSYGQEIQRSDSIRYLILYKYGGIYIDLDVKCNVNLDFFTTVDWISPPGIPTGLNNAFMAAKPQHPFLLQLVSNLNRYNLSWYSRYITIMISSGCHYISTMHATYSQRSTLRVLPKSYKLGGPSHTPIFDHLGAASWHRDDANFILHLGYFAEWLLVPWKLTFIGIACVVCVVGYVRYRRMIREDRERQREEDKELALLSSETSSENGYDL